MSIFSGIFRKQRGREVTNTGVPVALQEPARVEAGELAAGLIGRPPPAEQVAGVGLAIGDAVPALEDLLAGVVVAERGAREGVAHPLAGGVVAGLGPGVLARRGEGPRRGRGGKVEEEQKQQGQQEESEDEGAPPRPHGRAPRRRRHGGRPGGRARLGERSRSRALRGGPTQVVPRNFAGPNNEEGTSTGP